MDDHQDQHPSVGVLPAIAGVVMFGIAGLLLAMLPNATALGVSLVLLGTGLYWIIVGGVGRALQMERLLTRPRQDAEETP